MLSVCQAGDNYMHVDAVPLLYQGHRIGYISQPVLAVLTTPIFHVTEDHVALSPHLDTVDKRTRALADLIHAWRQSKLFPALEGWRDELYPVYAHDGICFVMERAATPLFGVLCFGVHVNITSQGPDGTTMWIGRRSATKQTWPNYLDNAVAGGIQHGDGIMYSVIKECGEEASIPHNVASRAVSCGAISYFTSTVNGLQPEVQYVFDLTVDDGFIPTPCDGEVATFYKWDMPTLKQQLVSGEFKPNCAMVVVDWMIRHGVITADNEPDYLNVLQHLHRRLDLYGPSTKLI